MADMIAHVLEAGSGKRARECSDLYHFTAAGAVIWFGLAASVFREAALMDRGFRAPWLVAITTVEFPLRARRPANSRLNCAKLAATFNLSSALWEAMPGGCVMEVSGHPDS